MARPVVIHVGPDGPAEQAMARLFRANGLSVSEAPPAKLAEAVMHAALRNAAPPPQMTEADLVIGLFRHQPHWRPPIEAWRMVDWMARHLPQALFVLTRPRPRDWSLWRLGTPALACHLARGHDPHELPGLWQKALQRHLNRVERRLGQDPRLIRLDLAETTPADLGRALAPRIALPACPDRAWPPLRATQGLGALMDLPEPPEAPEDWAEDVARFCLAGLRRDQGRAGIPPASDGPAGLSPYACDWDGTLAARGAVTDPAGRPRQIALGTPPGAAPLALTAPGRPFKLIRAEGVINDILALDRRDPVRIDMEDSRWFGSPQGVALDRPVLCHNRREDAVNAVLWPLPDQHAVGLPGFDPAAPPDDIAWQDKEDRLVWRGMISGSEMREGTRPGPASHVWLTRLAEAADPAAREAAWQGLCRTNRMAVILRHQGDADINIGIVMAWAYRHFADDPLLAPLCRPRMGPGDFNRYRYRLCLTGYDHGSNFVSGLDHNGVLLAVEDGWQVFYSGRFRPWRHYIPLDRHATDLRRKLDWARAHPEECRAISAAARAEAAHLRDRAARARLMRLILDGLAATR